MKNYIVEGPQAVDQSKYKNIDFKDRVVGSSTPSKDKINPSLLADVDKAAGIAGTKGSVTTAVTGHRTGSRHNPGGLAVDLAMFDGKGYHSVEDAKKKGIYDKIEKFVKALESMGYKVNSESGNDKAVLWFGFPNHHHHVHVSRLSDDGESKSKLDFLSKNSSTSDSEKKEPEKNTDSEKKEPEKKEPEKKEPEKKEPEKSLPYFSIFKSDVFTEQKINEDINRIKDLMKKIL